MKNNEKLNDFLQIKLYDSLFDTDIVIGGTVNVCKRKRKKDLNGNIKEKDKGCPEL